MTEMFFMSFDVISYIIWEAWIDFFIKTSSIVLLVAMFIFFISRIDLEEDEDN